MTRSGKRDLRYAVGEPYGSEPIKILCPNPHHEERTPSYAVYADGAYCFGCGFKERPRQFLERVGYAYEKLPNARTPTKILRAAVEGGVDEDIRGVPRETDTLLWHHHDTLTTGPRQCRCRWFIDRGFDEVQLRRFRFGHTGSHFVIPVWYGRTIVGYKRRVDPEYWDGTGPKYLNPRGQNTKVVRPAPDNGPIVIVEGELDAYLLSQFGVDTITTTTGARSLHRLLIRGDRPHGRGTGLVPSDASPVYVATDLDQAGDKAAEEIAHALPNRTLRCRWDRGGDISEYLLGIQSEERYKAVKEMIQNARPNTVEASG